jgi:hypothetical protein
MVKKYATSIEKLMIIRFSSLPEKARRHYAAEEALKLGHGGVSYLSNLFSIERNTIMKGQKELRTLNEGAVIDYIRQRKPGGGSKKKARNDVV